MSDLEKYLDGDPSEIAVKSAIDNFLDGMTHIDELPLYWKAHYTDGTSLSQDFHKGTFDPETDQWSEEHHFGHVDQSRLEIFELEGIDKDGTPRSYQLHVNSGLLNLNGFVCQFKILDKVTTIENRRVLFFRRTRVVGTPYGSVTIHRFLLGWQGNYRGDDIESLGIKDGQNIQRVVLIEPDGLCSFMNNI